MLRPQLKLLLGLFISFLWQTCCFAQTYIPVPGDTSGYTAGTLQITDGGAANYSIPLIISPGTNGVQPSLALSYNSQGGNSIVGQGWSLQGISAIARTAQTYAQDGRSQGITYNSSDRFSLDGERMVLVDSNNLYGDNGIEYRTEQNAFYKINSFGNTGGRTPKYFTVRTNSGNIMEYGNTNDSRIKAGETTLFWIVNKISDTKGNYFTFSYYQNPITGEYYPTRIDYTGNSNAGLAPYAHIEFEYEDRNDNTSKYLCGKIISSNTKRLTAIKSYFKNTLVRAYYLSYQYSPGKISQLTSIKECGSDGHCHTPTNFVWSNISSTTFNSTDFPAITKTSTTDQILGTDINADGTQDILKIPAGSAPIEAYLSNKSFSSLAFNNMPLNPGITLNGRKLSLVDFNGDGKQDFFVYDSSTGANTVCVNTYAPGSTQLTNNQIGGNPVPAAQIGGQKIIITMDFNMDGRTDVLSFDPSVTGGTNYWMFSNTVGNAGISFIPNGAVNYFTNILPTSLFTGNYQPVFADFTGDGLTDILFWNSADGTTKLYKNNGAGIAQPVSFALVTTSLGTNIINPASLSAPGGNIQTSDVNGDGLPDILFYIKSSGSNSWWINTGNNIFIPQSAAPSLSASIAGGTSLLQLDFNGDGFSDLVWMDKATGANRWLQNDGKLNFTLLPASNIDPSALQGYDLKGSGNFTSKSNFDFFLFNNSARILKGAVQYNNLLSQIQVGSGQVFNISYEFLTADSVYQKSDDAVYPLVDYQATQFVVKKWQTDNGLGGKSATSYRYYGAKIHVNGRGYRGFSQVDITDENTGIINSRYYLSGTDSWKYLSSPLIKTITRLPNGTIISQTDIQNGLQIYFNGKCHYSFVKNNSSKTYEIDGSFVDSTNTSYVYDDYGNVTATVTNYGDGFRDSLVNTYSNYSSNWIVSRLDRSKLFRFAPGKPVIVKGSFFQYDLGFGSGLLKSETIEPDSSAYVSINKTYTYDAVGNITSTSVTAWNGTATETRTVHTVYDALGRFPVSFTNAQGQVSYKTSDSLLGHTTTETDLNGLVKKYFYDGFGRLIKTVFPDGTWSTIDYRKSSGTFSGSPSLAYNVICNQSSAIPPTYAYYDLLNRELRTQKKGFNGQTVFIDNRYDSRGLLITQSLPYFSGDTIINTEIAYDVIGRKTTAIEPGNRIDSIYYHGRTTIFKNALGQKKTVVKNAKELMILCGDNDNNFIQYEYDAAGRLIKTTDPAGNNIIMSYDILGNKTSLSDPDMGTYNYVTNGFGELIKQTDPLGHTVTIKYDSLGRIKKRTEPEGTTNWVYDNRPHGIGMLGSISSYNGYTSVNNYDALSRPISNTQFIDGHSYTQSNTYDSFSRVQTLTYPSGLTLTNIYNSNGYLYQVKNVPAGRIYWTANTINAKNEVEQQQFGNGTKINKVYDQYTNFLTSINTQKGSVSLQNLSFAYDAIGNLYQRYDSLQSKEEDFYYDDLNRLIKSHIAGGDSLVMAYDALGNILSKSDVGTYHYGGVNDGPHQVRKIDLTTTQCIPSLLVNTQYNSFNKIKEISKDSTVVDIYYNPDRMRNVQKMYVNGSLVRTKVYVSGVFEREIKGGDTITTNYIASPDGIIGSYTTHSIAGIAPVLSYYHRDHLGSLAMITNDSGGVVARFSYDAWGKRRNADWSTILTDSFSLANDRGFTGHEHYDLFDLIDMNGRIYDPVLGRFLSADPYIQDMTNLQSFNRYAYVTNNPLSYTDPSGFFSIGGLFKSIFNAVASVVSTYANTIAHYASVAGKWCGENWRTIAVVAVAVVASVVTCGAATAAFGSVFLGAVCSGAAAGFASGVLGTLLSGGNIGAALLAGGKGAAIGASTAALTAGVGIALDFPTSGSLSAVQVGERSLANGIIEGSANIANGGKFLNGFYSGAASSGLSGVTANAGGVISSAIVGGTVSSLNGGKFADGAVTSAFQSMFSDVVQAGIEDTPPVMADNEHEGFTGNRSPASPDKPVPVEKSSSECLGNMFNVCSDDRKTISSIGFSTPTLGCSPSLSVSLDVAHSYAPTFGIGFGCGFAFVASINVYRTFGYHSGVSGQITVFGISKSGSLEVKK